MGRKGSGVEVRDSSIRVSFTYHGKPYRQTLMIGDKPMTPTPANIKYANTFADSIRDAIKHDRFSFVEFFPSSGDAPKPITVGMQLDTWLAAQRIEESTRAGYKSAIAFWKAAAFDDAGKPLGERVLRSLVTSDVMRALATRPTLSGKTVNNYVSVLREAVELAVTDKLLASNPVAAVKRAKHQKEPPDPFDRGEADKITNDFAARHAGQVANFVEFWFWTGMRTSEIFGLTWSSVDLAKGTILVKDAVVRGIHKGTKTMTARTVILNSRAMAALQRQRQHTQMAGTAVFQDPRQSAAWSDERAFRRSFWTPCLKRLGIRYRRPYQMRHTYATTMLMAGMTPAFCAKQLGHSVEMFLRTYSKWLDGEQNDLEMKRLEQALANSSLALPQLGQSGGKL